MNGSHSNQAGASTLLRMTASIRRGLADGDFTLEEIYGDLGMTGTECEVNSCTAASEVFWEIGEDEGRNLCRVHEAMMIQEHAGDWRIPLLWHWDDGTTTETPGVGGTATVGTDKGIDETDGRD